MIIHPDLRALRSDDAPQRQAQAALIRAMDEWRAGPQAAAVLAGLEAFDGGAPLDACPSLAALFEPAGDPASTFARTLVDAMAGELGEAPLGHVPLRHFTDGTHSTLLLARAGRVTLSLVAIDGEGFARRPAPATVDFGPSDVWERVLAGSARAEIVACDGPGQDRMALDRHAVALRAGTVVRRAARRQALLMREVGGVLVLLRLQRRENPAGVTREYRLSDGALVHQAAGDPRDSRLELIMALLGRMERADAAPHMADVARGAGSAALRWQALRECLALDTSTGFRALCAIAERPGDPLAPPASALRRQLVAAHPLLAEREPCLA